VFVEDIIMTNVIVLNGCLRMEKSDTEKLLAPFLEGIKQAGASVETFYIKRLTITPCAGDLHCWIKNQGVCHIADDMQMLYPKLRAADIVVFTTPVYIPLPGEMQNLFNRLMPLIDPVLKERNGRTRARFHPNVKIKKTVLVSSSGWWEKGNFGTVQRIVKEFAADASIEFTGALLRPHVDYLFKNDKKAKEIYTAAKKVGIQLIKEGKMSKRLLDIISQPLVSHTGFIKKN